MKPDQIISTISYKGQTNTLALPDHNNRIQITYTPTIRRQQQTLQPNQKRSSNPANGSN